MAGSAPSGQQTAMEGWKEVNLWQKEVDLVLKEVGLVVLPLAN